MAKLAAREIQKKIDAKTDQLLMRQYAERLDRRADNARTVSLIEERDRDREIKRDRDR